MSADQNPIKKPEALRLAEWLDRYPRPWPEFDEAAALLRTQHALLERATESLHLCYEHCRLYHPEVEGNNVGADTRATLAAITQHLEPKP